MKARNVTVVGAQWGDEGKGKVVDIYSKDADYIVRFQGGNNAGHTLVVGGKKTVLHLIPSGVLHPNKTCLIANGVVFDPLVFFTEVDALVGAGVLTTQPHDTIKVSERAHVILPYHRALDRLREEHAAKSSSKIGTTVRGIGPAYEDKVARRGIQVVDLLHPNLLKAKLERTLEEKNVLFKHLFGAPTVDFNEVYESTLKLGERLKPFVSDVRATLRTALDSGRKILFEGAQGTLLDVDHGTYPFVTSSNTITGGVLTGVGLGPDAVGTVVGITKAYTTRVGTGPFATELETADPALAERLRKIGMEFGATTGRPRRVGWLDLVALKYAVEVNGINQLALMKADVLSGLDSVKVCTGYRVGSTPLYEPPSCIEDAERVDPEYTVLEGWGELQSLKCRTLDDLPEACLKYVRFIENYIKVPVGLLSSGPGREETIQILNPYVS